MMRGAGFGLKSVHSIRGKLNNFLHSIIFITPGKSAMKIIGCYALL